MKILPNDVVKSVCLRLITKDARNKRSKMRFANLVICTALGLSIFFASCSTKSSTVTPPLISDTSKPAVIPATIDAAQAEWEKTLAAAKKEGKVVAYGAYGLSVARDPLIRAFNERFGLTLEMTVGPPADLTAKLISERNAGIYTADIYMGGGASILSDYNPRNMLVPIEPYLILPEVKNPSLWFRGTLPFWEKKRASLATLANIPAGKMAINNVIIKPNELTSYKDLLNPKLKGVIVMADPTVVGGGNSWFHISYRLMGEDYLKELIKQEPVITRDFRLMTEWLLRGKSAVAIGADTGTIVSAAKDGAPVALLPPFIEGADIGLAGGVVGVLDKNPHPNATRVFINWILGKEAGDIISKTSGYPSERADATRANFDPGLVPGRDDSLEGEDYELQKATMPKIAREIFKDILR